MDDDVIVIYDEIDEEPEQFTAQNYEYMLAQALLTREAIQEKLRDPSESSNFQFIGSATHNNSIFDNFLAVTYGGVEQNFFKCRDCNEIFDKDPQKSLGHMRSHNCKQQSAPVAREEKQFNETEHLRANRSRNHAQKARVLTRAELDRYYKDPKERQYIAFKQKSNFKCFAWQFMDLVFYKGVRQQYARCRFCASFVSYTNKNGTSSIRKHALRCSDILKEKHNRGKSAAASSAMNNESKKKLGLAVVKSEPKKPLATPKVKKEIIAPKIEICTEEDVKPIVKVEKAEVLSFSELRMLYMTDKESKSFLFRKCKRKDLKNTFWNWLEEVYYNDMKQAYYKCSVCDTLILADDENDLAVHIANHNSKGQSARKSLPNKEKLNETLTELKPKHTKKHSLPAVVKTEAFELNEFELPAETIVETTHLVTNSIVDFIIASSGQSLSLIEDPSFRGLAQSLIHFGAVHGDRNANDLIPSNDTILKHSIPLRVRTLKAEIAELLANEPHLNISVDLVKDQNSKGAHIVSYMTVKAHFITDTFACRVFVLGANELRDNVTFEMVQEMFLDIMQKYMETAELKNRCIVVLNENNEALVKAFEGYVRLPSVTHSLELIVNQVLKVEDPELNISKTVVKIQQLFDHITTEHNYAVSKGECLLDLLEEFYEMNKPIEKLLKETRPCQRDHSALSNIHKNTVKTILNGFEVIKLCVDTIRQNQITINGILLWKKKLIEQYSPVLYEHRMNARLKFHTLELIQSKFLIEHPIYKIALFLNPNFKNLKFLSESDRQEVFDSIKEIFLTKIRVCGEEGCKNDENVIEQEINRYFITKSFDFPNEDLLEFWKKMTLFPHMRSIARHILSIPGTSDGVNEEVFQKANRSLASGVGTSTDFNSIIFLQSNVADV